MRSEPARLNGISIDFAGISHRWTPAGGPATKGGIDFSVMRMYMFCFRILSRFDLNMATRTITMTTAEK